MKMSSSSSSVLQMEEAPSRKQQRPACSPSPRSSSVCVFGKERKWRQRHLQQILAALSLQFQVAKEEPEQLVLDSDTDSPEDAADNLAREGTDGLEFGLTLAPVVRVVTGDATKAVHSGLVRRSLARQPVGSVAAISALVASWFAAGGGRSGGGGRVCAEATPLYRSSWLGK
ncbi:hypothetical protein LR48_Vigan09g118700 [Vigna angularis]|uniref:Uncharacterized protein n=1 Tax=Phaseolus angularis TaxID=3914 RepID=A0A0L9VC00_PHAAN|nr:hypothetical protein LR48_Vigan09g118700 [Vigna angularis]